jgi:vancomycin resistance protein YoaR
MSKKKRGKYEAGDRVDFVRGTALSVALFLLISALGVGIWWFFKYTEDDGLVYPNVYVFGENLGGLSPEGATERLHALTDGTYSNLCMTVNLPDRTLNLAPEQTGAAVDVDALVQLALAYGREGNRWENTQARAAAALTSHDVDVASCLTLNADAIRQVLDQAAADAASTLSQTVIAVEGERPNLDLTWEQAAEQTETVHQKLTVVLGTPERSLDVDELMERIRAAYCANDFAPMDFDYDVVEPDAVDWDAVCDQHSAAPVDAVLNTADYTVTPEKLGYTFDLETLKKLVTDAGEGQRVTVDFAYAPAARTAAQIDDELFGDVLASVSTSHTNESNRNTNLRLACQALNGKLVLPGETLSYNETLGERTREKGYKAAGAYIGNKTVPTVGGGICQVSSTLYYACLKADLEIVQRTAHGFTVSYVPYGMDATVSWGTLDFKFKNNTDKPIRIEADVSGGKVHVTLKGVDDKDYYIKMTYETVDGPHEGEVVYEDFPVDNKDGYKDGDVVQTPYTGRTVKSYRCKYDKETDELISKNYEATSRYDSRDKIIARVQQPTEPSEGA